MSDTVVEVVAYIWARLRQVGYPNSSPSYTASLRSNVLDFLRLTLSAYLLFPGERRQRRVCRGVTTISSSPFFYSINVFRTQSPSHRRSALARFDVCYLYSASSWSRNGKPTPNPNSKPTRMTQKLFVYGARLIALPFHILTMVSEERLAYIELMRPEYDARECASPLVDTLPSPRVGKGGRNMKFFVEET